jgi:UDP-N-acetylglucosamine 2-epimerase (hydrolysing)
VLILVKIKSLISLLDVHASFEVFVFSYRNASARGIWLYLIEIERCNFKNIQTLKPYSMKTTMDLTLAKTIEGCPVMLKK